MLSATQLLLAFQQFCQTLPTPLGSLEPLDDTVDMQEALGAKGALFEPIAQEKTGGFVAFWQEPGIASSNRPIVWLSGDGAPIATCANSLEDFLSVLPYGTGLICGVLNAIENHRDSPTLFRAPAEVYPPAVIAEKLASTADSPAFIAYKEWLAKVADLPLAQDPVVVITQAFASHQDVAVWLDV